MLSVSGGGNWFKMNTQTFCNPQQRPIGALFPIKRERRGVLLLFAAGNGRWWLTAEVFCSYLSFHRGKFGLHTHPLSTLQPGVRLRQQLLAFRRIVGSVLLLLLLLLRELKLCMVGCWWVRPSVERRAALQKTTRMRKRAHDLRDRRQNTVTQQETEGYLLLTAFSLLQ